MDNLFNNINQNYVRFYMYIGHENNTKKKKVYIKYKKRKIRAKFESDDLINEQLILLG